MEQQDSIELWKRISTLSSIASNNSNSSWYWEGDLVHNVPDRSSTALVDLQDCRRKIVDLEETIFWMVIVEFEAFPNFD